MKDKKNIFSPSEAALLATLQALASPQRLQILAALHANGRNYVSQLAREVESADRSCICICRNWRKRDW